MTPTELLRSVYGVSEETAQELVTELPDPSSLLYIACGDRAHKFNSRPVRAGRTEKLHGGMFYEQGR